MGPFKELLLREVAGAGHGVVSQAPEEGTGVELALFIKLLDVEGLGSEEVLQALLERASGRPWAQAERWLDEHSVVHQDERVVPHGVVEVRVRGPEVLCVELQAPPPGHPLPGGPVPAEVHGQEQRHDVRLGWGPRGAQPPAQQLHAHEGRVLKSEPDELEGGLDIPLSQEDLDLGAAGLPPQDLPGHLAVPRLERRGVRLLGTTSVRLSHVGDEAPLP